jgi:hypothetical protein
MGAPRADDRVEAQRRFLTGLGRGDDPDRLLTDLADLHIRNNTFPGEVFMHIAVDALDRAGVDRQHPVDHSELLSTHLAEVEMRGKQQRRIQYCVLATFAVHGGLDVDLLDEVTYGIDQYWQYALLAAIAIVRACAARSELTVDSFVNELAVDYRITIT